MWCKVGQFPQCDTTEDLKNKDMVYLNEWNVNSKYAIKDIE